MSTNGIKWSVPLSAFGEAAPEEDQNDSFFGDIGTAAKQGFTSDLARTVTGAVDIGGWAVGADTSLTAEADKAGLADLDKSYYNELTPETKRALQNVENAEGFVGTLGAYIANPRAAVYDVARTFAPMVTGVGVGSVIAKGAGKLGARAAAKALTEKGVDASLKKDLIQRVGEKTRDKYIGASMAAGEGIVGAGSTASSIAQYNAENPDARTPLEGVGWAIPSGIATGAVAGIAGKIGGSIESALGNRTVRQNMQGGLRGVGRSALTEGVEELAQAPGETIPQNIATDQPWDEGLGENMASSLVAGSALGGGLHGAMYGMNRARHRWARPGEGRPSVPQESPNLGETQGADAQPFAPTGTAPAEQTNTVAQPVRTRFDEINDQIIQQQAEREENERLEKQIEEGLAEQDRKRQEQQTLEEELEESAAEEEQRLEQEAERANQAKQEDEAFANYKRVYGYKENERPNRKGKDFKEFNERSQQSPGYARAVESLTDSARELRSSEFARKRGTTAKPLSNNVFGQRYQVRNVAANTMDAGAVEPEDYAQAFESKAHEVLSEHERPDDRSLANAVGWELAARAVRDPEFKITKDEFDKRFAELDAEYTRREEDALEAYNAQLAREKMEPWKNKQQGGKSYYPNGAYVEAVNISDDEDSPLNATIRGRGTEHKFLPDVRQVNYLYKRAFDEAAQKKMSPELLWARLYERINEDKPTEAEFKKANLTAPKEYLVKAKAKKAAEAPTVKDKPVKKEKNKAEKLKTKEAEPSEEAVKEQTRKFLNLPENKQDADKALEEFENLPKTMRTRVQEYVAKVLNDPKEEEEFKKTLNKDQLDMLERIKNRNLKRGIESNNDVLDNSEQGKNARTRAEVDPIGTVSDAEEDGGANSKRPYEKERKEKETDKGADGGYEETAEGALGKPLYKALRGTPGTKEIFDNADLVNKNATKFLTQGIDFLIYEDVEQDAWESIHEALSNENVLVSIGDSITGVKNPATMLEAYINLLELANKFGAAEALEKFSEKPLFKDGKGKKVGLAQYIADKRATQSLGDSSRNEHDIIKELDFDAEETRSFGDYARLIDGSWHPFARAILGKRFVDTHPTTVNFWKDIYAKINYNGIRKIQAATDAGKKLQKKACYILNDGYQGVGIKFKDVLQSKDWDNDFKGLFTDRFIKEVLPEIRKWIDKGYPINEDAYLVDTGYDLADVFVRGKKLPADNNLSGMTQHGYARTRYVSVSLDGKALPTVRNGRYDLSHAVTYNYLGKGPNKLYELTLPFHELTHHLDSASGDKLGKIIANIRLTKDAELKDEIDKLAKMTLASAQQMFKPLKITQADVDGINWLMKYPQDAADDKFKKTNDLAEKEATYNQELAAVVFSLGEKSQLFNNMLSVVDSNGRVLPLLAQINQEMHNDALGAVLHFNTRSTGSGTSPLRGNGNLKGTGNGREDSGAREGVLGQVPGLGEKASGQALRTRPDSSTGLRGDAQAAEREVKKLVDQKLSNLKGTAAEIAGNLKGKVFKTVLGALFTKDVLDMAYKKTGIKAFKDYGEAYEGVDAFRNEIMQKVARVARDFGKLEKASQKNVNEFIANAVVDGAWGYADPSHFKSQQDYDKWKSELTDSEKDAEAKMAERWKKLSDSEKRIVKDVFNHGAEMLKLRTNLALEQLSDEFMERIGKDDVDMEALSAEYTKRKNIITGQLKSLEKKPYSPLRRFGTHVVIVQSAKYLQKVADMEAYAEGLSKLKEVSKEQRKMMEKLRHEVDEMVSNSSDYIVEFVDGEGTAKKHADSYKAKYPGATVTYYERMEADASSQPTYKSINALIKLMEKELNDNQIVLKNGRNAKQNLQAMKALATRMYIDSLSEESARKQLQHRRKVSGYNEDMMQNFLETAPSTASMLAFMKHQPEINTALQNIREGTKALPAGKAQAEAAVFQNEILRRHNLTLQPNSKLANSIMRTTSVWMLLTNPAFYIQNATQPFMMSAPFMAGRHGARIFGKLASTYYEVCKMMRDDLMLENIQQKLAPDEWKALDHSRRHGYIDIGITQDFGEVVNGDNQTLNYVKGMTNKLTNAARAVEIANRVATFLTAYRAEKQRTGSAVKAREYADRVLYETHGNYSAFNAPYWFNFHGAARVMTQFRKFQLIQLGMMTRMIKTALKGATPEERQFAWQSMKWTAAMHLAFTGVLGTPFAGVVLWGLAQAFGDVGDDEEDWIRKMIGDKPTGDLILRGLPAWAGVDVSGKIGAENMLNPFAYANVKSTGGRESANELLASLLGPSASLVQRAFTGAQYAAQGDIQKGIEYLLPNGVATNLSKAIRYSTEGYTSKAGDTLIKPSDYDLTDAAWQFLGLPTSIVTDRQKLYGSLLRHEEAFEAEKNKISMDYKKAFKDRDRRGMAESRQALRELNKELRKQGFGVYPLNSLMKTATAQRKREQRVVGGVPSTTRNRQWLKKRSEI